MYTQKEAWKFLAKQCSKAKVYTDVVTFSVKKNGPYLFFGLCPMIDELNKLKLINNITQNQMKNKIAKEYTRCKGGLIMPGLGIWPFNEEGRQMRIKFCKKMVKELERKR